MKVSELAERAGIAPSAVRWYESVGIIPPAARQPNCYREFAEEDWGEGVRPTGVKRARYSRGS